MSERETVTEAAVEAAAKELAGRLPDAVSLDTDGNREPILNWPDDFAASERAVYMIVARAALEAALPLLVAGERERCAKIAEGTTAYDDNVHRSAGCGTTGERIASAIRADKGVE